MSIRSLRALQKTLNVIATCRDLGHLKVADKMVIAFLRLFPEDSLSASNLLCALASREFDLFESELLLRVRAR